MATSDTPSSNTTKAPDASGETTAPKSSHRPLEIIGLIGAAAILAIFVTFLVRMLSTDLVDANAHNPIPLNKLNSPIVTDIIKITDIDASWRMLRESDRTDKLSKILPEITLSVAPATATPAFLKIQFYSPEGEISGDVKTIKISADTKEAIYGTRGIIDETTFVSYKFGAREGDWSVEILESSDYGSEEWQRLAYFTMPNVLQKPESAPAQK